MSRTCPRYARSARNFRLRRVPAARSCSTPRSTSLVNRSSVHRPIDALFTMAIGRPRCTLVLEDFLIDRRGATRYIGRDLFEVLGPSGPGNPFSRLTATPCSSGNGSIPSSDGPSMNPQDPRRRACDELAELPERTRTVSGLARLLQLTEIARTAVPGQDVLSEQDA